MYTPSAASPNHPVNPTHLTSMPKSSEKTSKETTSLWRSSSNEEAKYRKTSSSPNIAVIPRIKEIMKDVEGEMHFSAEKIDKNQDFAVDIATTQKAHLLSKKEGLAKEKEEQSSSQLEVEISNEEDPFAQEDLRSESLSPRSDSSAEPATEVKQEIPRANYEESSSSDRAAGETKVQGEEKSEKLHSQEKVKEETEPLPLKKGSDLKPEDSHAKPEAEQIFVSSERIDWQQLNLEFTKCNNINEILAKLPENCVRKVALILVNGDFEEIHELDKADLIALQDEKQKFHLLTLDNNNTTAIQNAILKHGHKFGINPNNIAASYTVPQAMWGNLVFQLGQKYPNLFIVPQVQPEKPDKSTDTTQQSGPVQQIDAAWKSLGPWLTKINQKPLNQLLEKIAKRVIGGLLKNNSIQDNIKFEQKQVLNREILQWTLKTYNLYKENLDKENLNKAISRTEFLALVSKWRRSLPPFPIIVRSDNDLYSGDLKAKTLELENVRRNIKRNIIRLIENSLYENIKK